MAISPAIGVLSGAVLTYYWGYQGCSAVWPVGGAVVGLCRLATAGDASATGGEEFIFGTLGRMIRTGIFGSVRCWWRCSIFACSAITNWRHSTSQRWDCRRSGSVIPVWYWRSEWVSARRSTKFLIGKRWLFPALVDAGLRAVADRRPAGIAAGRDLVVCSADDAGGDGVRHRHFPILARALRHYKDCMGTAGAILGLMYYLMLGGGLVLAGAVAALGCRAVALQPLRAAVGVAGGAQRASFGVACA